MRAFDWDDLRFALAVASGGSLAAGGRLLGVNHTTVLRRIAALEKRLGARLFERLPSGYALTPLGEELVEAARGVDEAVGRLELKLAGADLKVSGPVRVTTTDTLAVSLLPEILGELKLAHPGIEVELTTSNLFLNLTRREADVAIRPADDPPDVLFGRRISAIGFAVYGKRAARRDGRCRLPSWRAIHGSPRTTACRQRRRHAGLHPPCPSRYRGARRFLRDDGGARRGRARPCRAALLSRRPLATLMRMSQPIEAMRTSLWLLTHEQLRRTARIRIFLEFVGAALAKRRKAIEGGK